MKDVKEVTALVVDYGNFICLADKLGETMKKVYYYSPFETEYRDATKCIKGEGVPTIERLDEFMEPSKLAEIDLFVFPDIGFTGLQHYLESLGKPVWGSREVTDIELYRSMFLDVVAGVGLPVAPSKVVRGLSALEAMLNKAKDVWVKLDVFRENMETWHHIDYEHSLPMLRHLEVEFGGVAEEITFIVQSAIPNAQENGYDGYCVDGKFPGRSFQGYEKKNELYLGMWMNDSELPKELGMVNGAMAGHLKGAHYRNFWATEIRNEFFIDPTPRMAGQSQEHLLETMANLSEVIWAGAHGQLVEPEFRHKFAASATLHYKEVPGENWKSVRIPKRVQRWFKLANYCRDGDVFNFPPGRCDEVGVVIGNGDTVEEALTALKSHLGAVKDEPISAETKDFADIIRDIQKAGVDFGPLPSPESLIAE